MFPLSDLPSQFLTALPTKTSNHLRYPGQPKDKREKVRTSVRSVVEVSEKAGDSDAKQEGVFVGSQTVGRRHVRCDGVVEGGVERAA